MNNRDRYFTQGKVRRVRCWEHEGVIDAMQARLEHHPAMMRVRRQTVEHPFGTLKYWMGSTHFLTRTLPRVSTEMSLHVLAYNLKRMMSILASQACWKRPGRESGRLIVRERLFGPLAGPQQYLPTPL